LETIFKNVTKGKTIQKIAGGKLLNVLKQQGVICRLFCDCLGARARGNLLLKMSYLFIPEVKKLLEESFPPG
jgi:hypothetical protein